MQYNKTNWVDHIVDGSGNVVQQGTPLSAGNLLKLEKGVKDATLQLSSELAAAAAHSGVLDFLDAIPNLVTTPIGRGMLGVNSVDPNTIYLGDAALLIAGQVINYIRENSIGILPAPPATGKRYDLLFMEAWKDQTTQEWQRRLRTVDGIDFETYAMDGIYKPGISWDFVNRKVTAQGGNATPIAQNSSNSMQDSGAFVPAIYNSAFNAYYPNNSDQGLYIAGNGTDAAKGILKSSDGYVYLIPIAKIERRNTGAYSAANPDGARNFFSTYLNGATPEGTTTVTLGSTSGLQAGDTLVSSDAWNTVLCKIISVNSATQVTTTPFIHWGGIGNSGWGVKLKADRPDGLYANIIAERDITDLRHQVSLTGYDRKKMLEEGIDLLLRGALETSKRKKMLKTYHGVRKTPLDANHVFYASLDSTNVAELGGANSAPSTPFYVPMMTGAGLNCSVSKAAYDNIPHDPDKGTVDVWMVPKLAGSSWGEIVANGNLLFHQDGISSPGLYRVRWGDNYDRITLDLRGELEKPVHVRITWDSVNVYLYKNGVLYSTNTKGPNKYALGNYAVLIGGAGALCGAYISDVALSNINRGATFATLPADFISGQARITNAFTGQRLTNSDVLTSQYTTAKAKVQNQTQERGVTVTKGGGNVDTAAWEAGDKIKVRGLAGEVIMGVLDSDTALAMITEFNTSMRSVIKVSDVSKFVVGDTFQMLYGTDMQSFSGQITVNAIDTVNSTLTINTNTNWSYGTLLFESTASTSSPVVKANIAGVITTVPGTWADLGKFEAEFTLGTLPGGLDVEEIFIDYGLAMPAGQGGVPEVYTATLAGEMNGHKLVPGVITIVDDFAGKVSGSTIANQNISKGANAAGLLTPSNGAWTEINQTDYGRIEAKGGTLNYVTATTNGQNAMQLFSWNIVEEVERKLGTIPALDKLQWVKDNLYKLWYYWYGYGVSPAGNKATLKMWDVANSVWRLISGGGTEVEGRDITTAAASTKVFDYITAETSVNDFRNYIDANGFVHMAVYADASNGTVASTIYTDYVNIELEAKTKWGYDMLVPENPRRDAGKAGLIYVRKESKEVLTIFKDVDEDNGVITFGDYVPYQGGLAYTPSKFIYHLGKLIYGTMGSTSLNGTTDNTSLKYRNIPSRIKALRDDLTHMKQLTGGLLTIDGTRADAADYGIYGMIETPIIGHGAYNENYQRFYAGTAGGSAAFRVMPVKNVSGSAVWILFPTLAVDANGKLVLAIHGIFTDGSGVYFDKPYLAFTEYFELPGKPLIKGA